MPTEIVDPSHELPDWIRDEIDLAYRSKHRRRILDILEGKRDFDGNLVRSEDPYPVPENLSWVKGNKFAEKIARENGWM